MNSKSSGHLIVSRKLLFLISQEWLEKKNVYLHEMHRIKRIESENLRIQNEQVS